MIYTQQGQFGKLFYKYRTQNDPTGAAVYKEVELSAAPTDDGVTVDAAKKIDFLNAHYTNSQDDGSTALSGEGQDASYWIPRV